MTLNFAIFGNPVATSVSPIIMQHFGKLHQKEVRYGIIQTDVLEFPEKVSEFLQHGGQGGNVTAPCKRAAFEFVDHHTERAKMAGAVNTFWKQADGSIKGDNTDGVGFLDFLKHDLHFEVQDKKILILGAGGAVDGILPSLHAENFSECVIMNRSLDAAEKICAQYDHTRAVLLNENFHEPFDLVIHSLGAVFPKIHPGNCRGAVVCHLSYTCAAEEFLDWAALVGGAASTHNGYGMVLRQAEYGFEDWFGVRPRSKLGEILALIKAAQT